MKKILNILLIMMFIFPIYVSAKGPVDVDYKVHSVYINSQLDFIGSLHITEAIVIEGSLNGYEREINYKDNTLPEWEKGKINFEDSSFYNARGISLSKVSSFKVNENEVDWTLFNKLYSNFKEVDSANSGDEGVYTISSSDVGSTIRIYNPNESGLIVYVFDYYINQAAVMHKDVAELYYPFISGGFDEIENLYIQLVMPGVSTQDKFRFWAHGSLNGEIAGISETKDEDGNHLYKGVLATLKNVKADSIVDIRVTFDKALISPAESFINKSDMIALDDIIALETEKANKSNKERMMIKFIYYATYVLAGIFFIGLIILWVYIYKKYDKEHRVNFDMKYYREFTGDYGVEVVEYLMKKNITPNSFSASILNLIYKKNIEIEEVVDKKKTTKLILKNKDKISPSEEVIINLLFETIGKDNAVTLKEIENYSKKETTARTFVNKYDIWKNLVIEDGKKEEFFETKMNPKIIGGAYFGLAIILAILVSIFNPSAYLVIMAIIVFALIFLIYTLCLKKWTKKGREHYLKWNAFKKFLDDFGTFEDKDLPEIILWEKYLVYACALGIAKKVQDSMKVHLANIESTDNLILNSYPNIYMNLDLSNAINVSMSKAITSSIAEVNAANAASSMSSGSGFGGGFSAGGGFGGRGGGGRGF